VTRLEGGIRDYRASGGMLATPFYLALKAEANNGRQDRPVLSPEVQIWKAIASNGSSRRSSIRRSAQLSGIVIANNNNELSMSFLGWYLDT